MTAHEDWAVAWSRQLAQAHTALRQQLHALQVDLDAAPAEAGLLAHCLAFCSALTAHHDGEDGGLFAELLRVRPDLRDVVRKLAEDHQMIAGILATVGDLAHEAAGATPGRREVIRRELGGLAAIMESHFGYEERTISDTIDNQVQDTGWTTAVFEFRRQQHQVLELSVLPSIRSCPSAREFGPQDHHDLYEDLGFLVTDIRGL